ncbi:MAG TPA: hypothetical protein VKF36_05880 [Syntrophorhabdales bacterium]|nr:hypothetical protein [Syntrophorhabdales bacterium]
MRENRAIETDMTARMRDRLDALQKKRDRIDAKIKRIQLENAAAEKRKRTRSLIQVGALICSKTNQQQYGMDPDKLLTSANISYQSFVQDIFKLTSAILMDSNPQNFRGILTNACKDCDDALSITFGNAAEP